MKTIKIPICSFGKDLNIDDIILGVMYLKGDRNNTGDKEDDYVEIVLKDDILLKDDAPKIWNIQDKNGKRRFHKND